MKSIGLCFILFGAFVKVWGQKLQLVLPIGHTNSVVSIAFSPDGKYILTGSYDKTAKLWDLSGHELITFKGHQAEVLSVAFSPDGKRILTGSKDKTAKLWDLSGVEIHTFQGHHSSVTSVAFSPNQDWILTGSEDYFAKLWDISGQELKTFEGHTGWIFSVAFSPGGTQILTGSRDHTAKLWDISGQERITFKGHQAEVTSVAFSPDGKQVLTGSNDKTTKLWDTLGHELKTFSGHNDKVTSVAFSLNHNWILTGSEDNFAKLWDLTGQEIMTFEGHSGRINSVAFSPNNEKILVCNVKQTKLLDLSGAQIQVFNSYARTPLSAAVSPDRELLLVGYVDNTARIWNLPNSTNQILANHGELVTEVISVAFSPNSKQILTGSDDARLWDLSGRELKAFKAHVLVNSVAFSPDGKKILTGSWDKTAKLWNLHGRRIKTFKYDLTFDVAFSPNGRQFLAGYADNSAIIWGLSGRKIQTLNGHSSIVLSVSFSPDGKQILTGSHDREAKLWNLNGQEIQSFKGHIRPVTSAVFSSDGQKVLTGSEDETAKLWNLSGDLIRTFTGHNATVKFVSFYQEDKYILTGSLDGTIKLWDTDTGLELATLIAINSSDWVVTTPSGIFDASPGAMKLMYYVQNLEFIDLDQLKERYYEPGLLAKIIGFDQGEIRNVANLNQVALFPEIKATIEKDQLNISLTARSGGLGKLSLFINHKEVQEDLNPNRLKELSVDLKVFNRYFQTNDTIALRAYHTEGWLKSQAYELAYQSPETKGTGNTTTSMPLPPPRSSLYAVLVGTSNYTGNRLDLSFADRDAEVMSEALQSAGSALFGIDSTHIHLLSSSGKTVSSKVNIQKTFADIAAKAKPKDILVVYFSGHGLTYRPAEKEQFYYLTKDIGSEDLRDSVLRNNFTISSDEFTQWLTTISAKKQVMILDACNGGKIIESLSSITRKTLDPSKIRALERMKDRSGVFILTGSAADKVSYEASPYGQGLLTYSLLLGMGGLALKGTDIDVMTLFQFARDQVPVLARGIGGIQTPVLAFPQGGSSFEIGIVDSTVVIPKVQGKPVFIRGNFQDENYGDGLNLVKELAAYFEKITINATQTELMYADVNEYEYGYSIRGKYKYRGSNVKVKGALFKGSTPLGNFKASGEINNLSGLAKTMLEKIQPLIK